MRASSIVENGETRGFATVMGTKFPTVERIAGRAFESRPHRKGRSTSADFQTIDDAVAALGSRRGRLATTW
jgi:hypothetical protein